MSSVTLQGFRRALLGLLLPAAGCTLPDVDVAHMRADAALSQTESGTDRDQVDAARPEEQPTPPPAATKPMQPMQPAMTEDDAGPSGTPARKMDSGTAVMPPDAAVAEDLDDEDAGACARDASAPACSARQCETDFVSRHDDAVVIVTEVPASWGNVWGNGWNYHPFPSLPTPLGPAVNLTSNAGAWFEDATTPGVFIGASAHLAKMFDPASVLLRYGYTGCTGTPATDWKSPGYTGMQVVWNCDEGNSWLDVAVWPEDHSYIVMMEAKITSDCDLGYATHAIEHLVIKPTSEWPEALR